MASPIFTPSESASDETSVWLSLKRAIAATSGFQRWKSELSLDILENTPLDQLVRSYLRETLETLAY